MPKISLNRPKFTHKWDKLAFTGIFIALLLFMSWAFTLSFSGNKKPTNSPAVQGVEISPNPNINPPLTVSDPSTSPIFQPSTQTLTQKVTPIQTTADPQQTQITHNGSRTGPIVKYHEWCTGNYISVYENERLEQKAADGKTYYMTKDDWDCYWKYTNSEQNNNPNPNYVSEPPNNNKPLITCTVTYPCTGKSYTYQLDQDTCTFLQQSAQSCTASSPIPSPSVYLDSAIQQSLNQDYQNYLKKQQLQANIPLNQQCKSGVGYTYSRQREDNIMGSYGEGVGTFMVQQLRQEAQQALAQCDQKYPTQ